MRKLYEDLLNNKLITTIKELIEVDHIPNTESPDNIIPKRLKFLNGDRVEFSEIAQLERNMMLGERMLRPQLASMLLFVCINEFLRNSSGDDPKNIVAYMNNWLDEMKDDRSVSNIHTSQWFELISGTYNEKNNNRYKQLTDVFHTEKEGKAHRTCLLYTSPSPRDLSTSRMPSSA